MEKRRRKLLLWAAAFIISLNLLGFIKLNILAREPDSLAYTRYYKSIMIHEGDSLWKIAERYCPYELLTTDEYVYELKRINGLTEDTIHAGRYLTIVYFESEPLS